MGEVLIVYAHRVQQFLKHGVVELGLTVELTDEQSPISLAESEQVFRQAAELLAIDCHVENEGNGARLIFTPR
ncbi:MAG: hypothetical protein AAFR52_00055 [Pseudomonadota bacterium]